MQKVTICKGLPGSGKSYWAKQYVLDHSEFVRINRDDLRNMRGKYWLPKQEDLITDWQRYLVTVSLENGYNVIIDDTNLNSKTVNSWIQLIKNCELALKKIINIEIKDFTNVDLDLCIKRDNERANRVGEKVIKEMYNKYLNPLIGYKQDPNWPHVVLCDLDGTMCLFGNNNAYDRDFLQDKVNLPVKQVVSLYRFEKKANTYNKLFLFSGRNNKHRVQTEEWLKNNNIHYDLLVMRKEGDVRKDSVVKREFFDEYVRDKYYVDFVLDDRLQVVELWRSLGLTCFQVADGNF